MAAVCQLSILLFASLPRSARSCCAGEGLLQQLSIRCQAALVIAMDEAESLINCRATSGGAISCRLVNSKVPWVL